MQNDQRKLYLPGLLGLRFLAAFSVYFGHLEQAKSWVHFSPFRITFSGGMPDDGVTLFFVLSGFLITYILFTEQQRTGTVQIKQFYKRRLLRIWPLYYLFTFLTFFVFPHIEFLRFPNLDMAINGAFWERVGLYLFMSPHVAITLFTHPGVGGPLWSVGVEEWFYVGWPHLIKRLKKYLPLGLLFVLAVPLLVRAYGNPIWAWFFHYFRIDCMAIGALGAWIWFHRPHWTKPLFSYPIQAVTYYYAWQHLKHGGDYGKLTYTVYSLVFISIIMNVALNPLTVLKLENRFFRFMGEISYGFYVFQWFVNVLVINLLLQYGPIESDKLRNWFLFLTTFGLTTGLASLSYFFYEKKFLRLKDKFAPIKSGVSALEGATN